MALIDLSNFLKRKYVLMFVLNDIYFIIVLPLHFNTMANAYWSL